MLGKTIAATWMHYEFRERASDVRALYGVVTDERVASITLTREARPAAQATIEGGAASTSPSSLCSRTPSTAHWACLIPDAGCHRPDTTHPPGVRASPTGGLPT